MPTENEAYTTLERGWIVRIQPPAEPKNPRSLLLLHGWTGDETVMWIFARDIPQNYWIFAPRGRDQSPGGGYGWLPHEDSLPKLSDFRDIAKKLANAFQQWAASVQAPQFPVDVMGFSQGAAMAYALAAYYPELVNRVVALAGFLPKVATEENPYQTLNGKRVYVAHGKADTIVPVHLAQEAVRTLQAAGAQVTYCESDVGHKLSADCLRGLDRFIQS